MANMIVYWEAEWTVHKAQVISTELVKTIKEKKTTKHSKINENNKKEKTPKLFFLPTIILAEVGSGPVTNTIIIWF